MNKLQKAIFITFEGGEGCGKSTQSKMLYEYLITKNIEVDLTREIGGTKAGEEMRNILVHQELLPMSELLQVMAARYEHIQKRIMPLLAKNITVICDRFIDSTACYQGQYTEIGMDLVYGLHNNLMSNLLPNITFLIDVKPEIAIKRALLRGANNKFEQKNIEFHRKIYDGFKIIAAKFPDRIKSIASENLNPKQVHEAVISMLKDRVAI